MPMPSRFSGTYPLQLHDAPPIHLTYCLNIHQGETWEENFRAIRQHTLRVRQEVCPNQPFGLGLRLSRKAAETLWQTERLNEFKRFLSSSNLYVFTVNGFPYGQFHETRIKENVYSPDWQQTERNEYTLILARILASLLPQGVCGSINTVPGTYKRWLKNTSQKTAILDMLTKCAVELAALRDETGKTITVGLEPEPDCMLETTDECVDFFAQLTRRAEQLTPGNGECIRRHMGICFDTCHMAVQYEDICASLKTLQENNITVAKIHLSNALATDRLSNNTKKLAPFTESIYLHQVKTRKENSIYSYPDLDAAITDRPADEEWRIHCHVPLFFSGNNHFRTLQKNLSPEFFRLLCSGITPHLEIETYTFDILPPSMREKDVAKSIVREYNWVLENLSGVYTPILEEKNHAHN